MKSLYLLLVTLVVSAVSCRTKDGTPGPSGDNGLTQQGSITASISFTDDNNIDMVKTLKYEYFESLSDNKFYYELNGTDSYYEATLEREDLKDDYNYITFDLAGNGTNDVEGDPSYISTNFYFVTLVNNELFEFNSYDADITNVNLDPTTGRLTFDYTCSAYYDNGNKTATVTGKVDVILNHTPKHVFNVG
ncbi:MAG TPA: hypothetical protein VK796_07885 [Cytophaga sp.]|jgi:hypothetical protein|nr:hypothetical protein [Cytophaga sp.]